MHFSFLSNIQYDQMAALFDLILCAFLVFDETEAQEAESRWFTQYLYFITITNGVEILAMIFCGPDVPVSATFKMIVISISFLANNVAFWLFLNYIDASSGEKSKFEYHLMGSSKMVLVGEPLLLLINLFLHNAFYFDENMNYVQGSYFVTVILLFPFYFVIESLILVKRNFKRMGKRKVLSILVAITLNVLGLVIQFCSRGTLLIALPFASLGIYVLYFAVESPDYRQLESTLHELSIAKQSADEASVEKDKFMSRISHEVRTPMNSILGLTDMILQEMQDKESLPPAEFSKVYQYTHAIANSGHQLIYVVDNIPNFITTIPMEEDGDKGTNVLNEPVIGEPKGFFVPDAHFLLVDDNEMNLFVAKKLLSKTGARITTCTGGLECLRMLTMEKFDLVFLDYMMPDMDGIEVIERTHKMVGNLNGNTPFVMVTANMVSGMEAKALESGFSDFISKPISWERLHAVLSAHLPNARTEEAKFDGDYQIRSTSDVAAQMELIDTAVGMEYCASDENFYQEALQVFVGEHETKAKELADYYDQKDWKLFTVRSHGLKSTARTIGALPLSNLAMELEMAGKKLQESEEDKEALDSIREKLPKLLNLYEKTVAAVVQLRW